MQLPAPSCRQTCSTAGSYPQDGSMGSVAVTCAASTRGRQRESSTRPRSFSCLQTIHCFRPQVYQQCCNAHGPSNTRCWAKLRRSRSKQSRNFTRQSARSMSSYGAHCKLDSTPTLFPLRSGLLPSASAKRPFACPEHLQLLSRTLSWDDS